MIHSWPGPHGVPGGTERWEHASYRWRRGVELVAVLVVVVVLDPNILEILAGVILMAAGLFVLAFMIIAGVLAGHRLMEGLAIGGLLGWLVGCERTGSRTGRPGPRASLPWSRQHNE